MKERKICGAANLPSTDWNRNSAWRQFAALACTLNAWLRHLALDGDLAKAEPKGLRYRLLGAPARHIVHARHRTLLIPPGWTWAADLATGWERLQALHPSERPTPPPLPTDTPRPDRGTGAHPSTRAVSARPHPPHGPPARSNPDDHGTGQRHE